MPRSYTKRSQKPKRSRKMKRSRKIKVKVSGGTSQRKKLLSCERRIKMRQQERQELQRQRYEEFRKQLEREQKRREWNDLMNSLDIDDLDKLTIAPPQKRITFDDLYK